ncbi:MAG: energy-coupling factor transporter ATPase [Candidatus Xenobia bacterium]
MIEFNNVSHKTILRDVTLRFDDGQFVALVGRNGSGKTTLVRHMNALLLPTQGTVLVDGMDTRDPTRHPDIRGHIGMVFQNPDHQIVAPVIPEEVAFGPENLGVPPEEVRERVEQALAATGLAGLRNRQPHQLSGGQKQRLAIASVLAMRPQWMVLDEPTTMLDPQGREEVLEAIMRLHREAGMGMVLVTHAMEEVCLADRVIVMQQGEVAWDGSPAQLFSDVAQVRSLGLHLPPLADVLSRLGVEIPQPLTLETAATRLLERLSLPSKRFETRNG